MTLEIRFPVEMIVTGVPLSSGASSESRRAWQSRIAEAARSRLQPGYWLTASPVSVSIFYFPGAPMKGDLDNIIKPILDGLSKVIYLDDRQVDRLLVQKFEPGREQSFPQLTEELLRCTEMPGPRTYLRIDDDSSLEAADGIQ